MTRRWSVVIFQPGPWQAAYAKWLAPYLGSATTPPPAAYLP
ncbi:hypothetical protein ABH930_002370 [Kitasatospora sp. GAS204A]|nr:hypothetical protein [Kitasatospora sp. GAS204B]